MAWTAISGTIPQYQTSNGALASGYYLKFYEDGTTTATNMATDSTGGTTLVKCQLSSLGVPVNGSGDPFIPHIDQAYKLILYKNATDADNNTTANAEWVIDNLQPVGVVASSTTLASTNLTHTPGHTGDVVATTAYSKFDERVSVFDYFTAAQIADVKARTGLLHVSTPINEAFSENKWVHFPDGLYIAEGLTPARDQIITGDGLNTVIKSTNTTGTDLMATPAAGAGLATDGFDMRNIRLQGAGAGAGGGNGLLLEDTTRWNLENVEIDGHGGDGLKVKDNTWIGHAKKCIFGNNGGDGAELQALEAGSSNFAISFISCSSSGNGGYGYHINPTPVTDGNVINIIGGDIEQNDYGIYCNRTRCLNIDGVYFEGNTTRKIHVTGQAALGLVMIRNIGGGGGDDIFIDSGAVSIDGIVFNEDGKVVDLSTDGSYEVKNFILNPATQTDPCYILERNRVNRGVRGLGNLIKNGNFKSWIWEQDRPGQYTTLGTATYARSTPPTSCSGDSIQITTSATDSGLTQTISNLDVNDVVTASCWIKATSGDTAVLKIVDDGEGQTRVLSVTATDWRRYTIQHKLSTGSTSVDIQIYGSANGDVVEFAELQVTQNSNLHGYLYNEQDLIDNVVGSVMNRLDLGATPSVDGVKFCRTRDTTTVTNFTGGVEGQELTILFQHAKTITDNANIVLAGSVNFVGTANADMLTLQYFDGVWYEKSRSVN